MLEMQVDLKGAKVIIRQYMQTHYQDHRLADLLCHARDGKLAYFSCCCFAGLPFAVHSLRTSNPSEDWGGHGLSYSYANSQIGRDASEAFRQLGLDINTNGSDDLRRRRIIPMILAEMRRRELLSADLPLAPREPETVEAR